MQQQQNRTQSGLLQHASHGFQGVLQMSHVREWVLLEVVHGHARELNLVVRDYLPIASIISASSSTADARGVACAITTAAALADGVAATAVTAASEHIAFANSAAAAAAVPIPAAAASCVAAATARN
eukprot:6198266-Pleurochrysis_carterae.AAC.1